MFVENACKVCGDSMYVSGKVLCDRIEVNQTILIMLKNQLTFYANIIEIRIGSVKSSMARMHDIAGLVLSDFGTTRISGGAKLYVDR